MLQYLLVLLINENYKKSTINHREAILKFSKINSSLMTVLQQHIEISLGIFQIPRVQYTRSKFFNIL